MPGPSSRVSPTQEPPGFEDFDFSPWMEIKREQPSVSGGSNTGGVNDLLDRTDHLRLECVGPNVSTDSDLRSTNLMKSINGNFFIIFLINDGRKNFYG